jgi:thiamine biosynthesis lipoprotein
MSKKQSFGFVFIFALLLVGLRIILTRIPTAKDEQPQQLPFAREVRSLLGTEVEISAWGKDAAVAIAAAFAEVENVHNTMSRFREGSDVWNINTSEAEQMIAVSEDTFRVIEESIRISEMTNGAFDITILPLMILWRAARKQGILPTDEEIAAARALVNWQYIMLDAENLTVGLGKAGMGIDLGGIATGYAVSRATAALEKHGIKSAMVNAGGDLYLLGKPQGREWWHIGIEDPREKGKIFTSLDLRDEAVVTSGDYRWYFMIGDRRFHHIIDPRTGFPVERIQSVTVVAPDATFADGLSTAIFVLGREEGMKLIETIEEIGVIIVSEDEDGNRQITISTNMKERVTLK